MKYFTSLSTLALLALAGVANAGTAAAPTPAEDIYIKTVTPVTLSGVAYAAEVTGTTQITKKGKDVGSTISNEPTATALTTATLLGVENADVKKSTLAYVTVTEYKAGSPVESVVTGTTVTLTSTSYTYGANPNNVSGFYIIPKTGSATALTTGSSFFINSPSFVTGTSTTYSGTGSAAVVSAYSTSQVGIGATLGLLSGTSIVSGSNYTAGGVMSTTLVPEKISKYTYDAYAPSMALSFSGTNNLGDYVIGTLDSGKTTITSGSTNAIP